MMTEKIRQFRANILPDFIIIGGQKCGTTSLHYYLNCHPEIAMSQEKELNFFISEKNWHKGIDWYKSQFKGDAKIYGEASPNYTNYPQWQGVPARIHSLLPQSKIIYIVRDPIERLISGYVHLYACGLENRCLSEAILKNINYLSRSRYYLQIEQFLEYFSLENIFICTAEDLSDKPAKTLKAICNFLGVSEDISMINYQKNLHKSTYKRRNNSLGNKIAKSAVMRQIKSFPQPYRTYLQKTILFPFSTPVKKPVITVDLQNQLVDSLQGDVDQFRKLTGQKFAQWCL